MEDIVVIRSDPNMSQLDIVDRVLKLQSDLDTTQVHIVYIVQIQVDLHKIQLDSHYMIQHLLLIDFDLEHRPGSDSVLDLIHIDLVLLVYILSLHYHHYIVQ